MRPVHMLLLPYNNLMNTADPAKIPAAVAAFLAAAAFERFLLTAHNTAGVISIRQIDQSAAAADAASVYQRIRNTVVFPLSWDVFADAAHCFDH